MRLRIGRDRDLEIADGLQAFHQVDGIREAARMRHVLAARALRRIAAQRDDVTNAVLPNSCARYPEFPRAARRRT